MIVLSKNLFYPVKIRKIVSSTGTCIYDFINCCLCTTIIILINPIIVVHKQQLVRSSIYMYLWSHRENKNSSIFKNTFPSYNIFLNFQSQKLLMHIYQLCKYFIIKKITIFVYNFYFNNYFYTWSSFLSHIFRFLNTSTNINLSHNLSHIRLYDVHIYIYSFKLRDC